MNSGYTDLSNEERLKWCGQATVERRKSRGGLSEAYKIIIGKKGGAVREAI